MYMYLQKVISNKNFPDSDPLVRGMDPRIQPRIRIHPKMSWIRNTGCHITNWRQWLNSWYLFVPCISNMFYKTARRIFEGRGEIVKCVSGPLMFCLFIDIYWSVIVAISNIIPESLIAILKKSQISIIFPLCFHIKRWEKWQTR
jgi:hypothetical protein